MTVLFSPVGTADPFTQLGDGPLIHIIRHWRPDKVVLYLSPAMARFQQQDGRYTKAIALLADSLGIARPAMRLVESDYGDVFRFDHYIEEFEHILAAAADGSQEILVNVSSGTAGMSQALVALGSFGRLRLKMIQVTTPKRGINSRSDREDPSAYDFDELWAWSQELEAEGPDRSLLVQTPNFAERLLKENVISLVGAYEYESAYRIALGSRVISSRAKELIRAASDRLNLNGQLPAKAFGGTELGYRANDLLGEYLSVMEVRLAQGHWAEFLKSLTPALTELMVRTLQSKLPAQRYQIVEGGRPTGRVDLAAVKADARLQSALGASDLKDGAYLTNEKYMRLVREYCEDEAMASNLEKLRRAEYSCRNKVAHRLKSTTREVLEKECGMGLDEIMESLYSLSGNAKPGLYGRINALIIREMG